MPTSLARTLRRQDGPHRLAAEVRKIVRGRLDILVANAGIANAAPIEDHTVVDFDRLFAINVRAPFFLVQQAPADPGGGQPDRAAVLAGGSHFGRHAVRLRRHQRCDRHAGEALRRRVGRARHPRQRPSHPAWSPRRCPASPKPKLARRSPSACRRSSASRNPRTSQTPWCSWPRTRPRWVSGDTLRVDGGSRL